MVVGGRCYFVTLHGFSQTCSTIAGTGLHQLDLCWLSPHEDVMDALAQCCPLCCRQLHEVALVAPHVRRLTLSHCGVLVSLALRCR